MLELKETEDSKIYVTSDWHLNHAKKFIFESRGYSSINEHNDDIISKTNEIVRPNDKLINLGDLILNSTIEQFEEFISRINCQNIYLLFGNHPNRHFKEIYKPMVKSILGKNYTDNSEIYPLRYKNIIYMGNYVEAIINNQMTILSHFPLLIWNNMSSGAICLTGHSHGSCDKTNSKGTFGKILDCGWDEFKRPISINEAFKIVEDKRYESIDHHE